MKEIDATSGPHEPTDWFAFLREFLTNPRTTASIAPSGKQLGKLMASAIPTGARRVVELGAGTGSITQALLRVGTRPSDLCIIEMNPNLHALLQARYPNSQVLCGDACDLEALSADWRQRQPCVDAICSSLGMLAIPEKIRLAIMTAAFNVLRPGGVFVQYTYGPKCPIGASIREHLRLERRIAGFAWRNLPPARVLVYERNH